MTALTCCENNVVLHLHLTKDQAVQMGSLLNVDTVCREVISCLPGGLFVMLMIGLKNQQSYTPYYALYGALRSVLSQSSQTARSAYLLDTVVTRRVHLNHADMVAGLLASGFREMTRARKLS